MIRPCLILIAASALVGCADTGDEGFVVLNNTAPPAGKCELTGALDQAFHSGGRLSSYATEGYLLTPLLESRITALVGQEVQRTIQLRGARVDLTVVSAVTVDPNGITTTITPTFDPSVTHFKQLVSGALSPESSANVGFEIIPAALVAQIASSVSVAATDRLHIIISASVVMYGELGGGEVDALPFVYPVEICNDCVLNISSSPCVANMAPNSSGLANGCNPYQDGVVNCCINSTSQLLCTI